MGLAADVGTGFSIEQAARGLGVNDVYPIDPFDGQEALAVLKEARNAAGVNVVVSHAPCAVVMRRRARGRTSSPFAIDQELCNSCSLCVRALGCPAILVADGEYLIDQELCTGCGLCAQVCARGAIGQAGEQGM